MGKTKLELIHKNDKPLEKIKRRDNVLSKDELIVIDRASSIDFSNIENNKNFVEIDIKKYMEDNFDENDKKLFDFASKLFNLRKNIYEKIKNDVLTFKPYAMLFDIAHDNFDDEFINDVEEILNNKSFTTKEIIEEILDILDDYIY